MRGLNDLISWTKKTETEKGVTEKVVNIKFGKFVADMHKEISFDHVNFIPFAPDEHLPADKIFNTFTGFKAKPVDTDNFEPIESIIAHLRDVLAAGQANLFEYLANWLAHIIQKPREKIGTAIVFQSEQGAGKNIFTDFMIQHVIGPRFAITINDIEQIVGRFNVVMENKLLTVCDEMGNFGGCYKTNDKLKSLITQAEQNIERKGIDTITVHDYNNYMMQSNNQWSVRVEASDRRYVVIGCGEHRIGDHDYFKALVATMTPANANLFLTWLARRDIREWNPRLIPDTELRRELKMRAIEPSVQFLIHLLAGCRRPICYVHRMG